MELAGCDISSASGSGVGIEGGAPTLRRCAVHDCERHGIAVFGNVLGGSDASAPSAPSRRRSCRRSKRIRAGGLGRGYDRGLVSFDPGMVPGPGDMCSDPLRAHIPSLGILCTTQGWRCPGHCRELAGLKCILHLLRSDREQRFLFSQWAS